MFLSFLLFGTFGFWALTLCAVVLIGIAVESEKPGWATTCLLTGFGLLAFFGDFNIFKVIAHHPVSSFVYVLVYLVIGTLWSVYKWYRFLLKSKDSFEQEKKVWLSRRPEFNESYDSTTRQYIPAKYSIPVGTKVVIPDELRKELTKYIGKHMIPSVNKNKGRITSWMMYWPTSVAWHLLSDWVLEIFDAIYRSFKGVFSGMRNRIFADVAKDMDVDLDTQD